jgi:hypothetical protein
MRKEIIVRNVGNYWFNREDVEQQLQSVRTKDTVLFHCLEGISLEFSGLLEFIQQWQLNTGHAAKKIQIWCINRKEKPPYVNICNHENKVWALQDIAWWSTPADFIAEPQQLFGLFIGRDSLSRNVIMYECHQYWRPYFLFSRMQQPNESNFDFGHHWTNNSDSLSDYLPEAEHKKFKTFWNNHPFESLDQTVFGTHLIGDAVSAAAVSLLKFYDQFGVELVLETMTRGTTFFPTEKTVRPIVGLKPFVTYASKNYLHYLRNLGFKTFDGIWDESYDNLEGIDRWHQMKKVVQYIINNPSVISQTKPIVEYNKNLLLTRKFSKDQHA